VKQARRQSEGKSLRSTATRKEREAAGKALRDKVTRRSHAAWKAPARRPNPVDVLEDSGTARQPQLAALRYGRMMQSPFDFFRGAAAIMAGDLAHTPASGIRVQASGDCHLANFGGFATPERNIVFDLNDFDETLPAPWEWDLKRLAASVAIAGRHNGFRKADARGAARCSVQSYREHIAEYARMRVLERWYERIDDEEILALVESNKWQKRIKKLISKESSRTVARDDFPKLTRIEKGRIRIKDDPPTIFHETSIAADDFDRLMKEAFQKYRQTLADDRRALIDQYAITDLATKVVGVGSVGTYCGILLMIAGDDDPIFLQVKEARASVLEPYAGKSAYRNRGQRVVAGQRLMQAASDVFLGWTEARKRHFYVRQLRDVKIKPPIEALDEPSLTKYAEWCGWALARAHAKSGDAAAISGYLGTSARFDDAIAAFAMGYAEQNERDHQTLRKAIRAGRIPAQRE
jgi:uncharacterized protein (DUF2252 family)